MARARIRSTASAAPKATAKPKAAPKLTLEQRLLVTQLEGKGIEAKPEYYFHATRKWRVDVLAVRPETSDRYERVVAIEIDGGIFVRGRHSGGVGQLKDMEKHNALAEYGFRLLRFTPQQVRDGSALEQIVRCL
jgi:hypothetical protein